MAVFFRFGVGILHSIENAVQFVHGTPKLAASHRTYIRQPFVPIPRSDLIRIEQHEFFWEFHYLSRVTGLLDGL